MSLFYAAALILNPANRTRYIKTHWPKKWSKPALTAVKKLWKRYKKEVIPLQSYSAFSYDTPSEPKELDTFNQIALFLQSVTRPISEDKYKDYNSQDSYSSGKEGALAWWLSDAQKQRWPRLALMTIDILLILPISDKPERCFLGARCTVT